LNKEGQGRPEGEPTLKEQGSSKATPEGGKDYRGMLSSIRANQELETFVADLRQNKEQLLSLAQELMRNRGNTRDERNAYLSVGIYLDVVLKQHVFGIDPFASKRPGDEELQELREALDFDLIKRIGSRWFKTHPDSKAAKAVSKKGHYALSDQHQRLLKEMWPSIRVVASSAEESAAFRAEAEDFLKKYVFRRQRP
jgi:hypothetical protein